MHTCFSSQKLTPSVVKGTRLAHSIWMWTYETLLGCFFLTLSSSFIKGTNPKFCRINRNYNFCFWQNKINAISLLRFKIWLWNLVTGPKTCLITNQENNNKQIILPSTQLTLPSRRVTAVVKWVLRRCEPKRNVKKIIKKKCSLDWPHPELHRRSSTCCRRWWRL